MAQAKLAQNKSFARRNNKAHQYLLRALVSCGVCQLSCFGRTLSKSACRYYVCAGKDRAIMGRLPEKCSSRYTPADQLEDLVWQDLCQLLLQPENITSCLERAQGGAWLPQELQARRENLRRGRLQLEGQLNRWTEAYLGGNHSTDRISTSSHRIRAAHGQFGRSSKSPRLTDRPAKRTERMDHLDHGFLPAHSTEPCKRDL